MMTGPTLVYAHNDFESLRVVSMLRAKEADVKYVVADEAAELLALHPQATVPCLFDRGLVCFKAPLDSLIHERYPAPGFLPDTPIQRAQLRMLTREVRGWYGLPAEELTAKLEEVRAAYENAPFYFSKNISIFDWALAPLLWWAATQRLSIFESRPFANYAKRVLSQPAFDFAQDLVLV